MSDESGNMTVDDIDRITAIMAFGARVAKTFIAIFDDKSLPSITRTVEVEGHLGQPMGRFEVTIARLKE